MNALENLDKVVQSKILEEFQGFSCDNNSLYINLDEDYPLMYKKETQFLVMDNLYTDMVESVKESAREMAAGNSEEFLKSMVALLNKEVDSFFEKRFESFKATVQDFISSQERVYSSFEERTMFEFLSDKRFQESLNTKEMEFDEFIAKYVGKKVFDDSERTFFITKLENLKENFTELSVLFFDFQKLMKAFMELTSLVKNSAASQENKAAVINNLKLLQEISVEQMKSIDISKFNKEAQSLLFQKELTVSELVSTLS